MKLLQLFKPKSKPAPVEVGKQERRGCYWVHVRPDGTIIDVLVDGVWTNFSDLPADVLQRIS
jgi:hypothetical protein